MKITDYPSVQTLVDNNVFLIDGPDGTKTITMKDLVDSISKSMKAVKSSIVAKDFSPSNEYEADDYCIYEDKLYRFVEFKDYGPWDEGVAEATTIMDEIHAIFNRLDELESKA